MLDASIYRGINAQQPAPYDPAQTYTKALALRSLVDEGAMRQMQMTQAQQAMADDDAYRAAAREAGGDMMKLRDLLYTKGLPKQGMAVGEAARKGLKDDAEIAKVKAETLAKNIGSMRDLIAQATSDADMPIIRDHALRLFGPEGAANVPDRFDPAWQKARIQDAQSKIKALTPNYQTVNAGDRVEMVQMNPDAPGFAPTPIRTGQSPDSVASNATAIRGQNLADARGREANDIARINAGTKAPAGYRFKADGQTLEPIPGGPATKLTEAQQKQLTGATNLQSALDEYKAELDRFGGFDQLTPDARAAMGTKYNNALLQAKEAYNLGVLNGPDYSILQQVLTNPMSLSGFITSKGAMKAQADELGRIMGGIANVARQGQAPQGSESPPKPAEPKRRMVDW